MNPIKRLVLISITAVLAGSSALAGQPPPPSSGPPPTPRAMAPVDFTGVWVSVVSEDWRWRMMTPTKGDYVSVPLTRAGLAAADTWDPARDEAASEQCRSYAAPAIMRVPGRVRISWQDDYTLKIETDSGMQTRLLRFAQPNAPLPSAPEEAQLSWQGFSVARWEPQPGRITGGSMTVVAVAPPIRRSLEVKTTKIRPGYLRKNGVPFSADTVLTEHFDAWQGSDGERFTVLTIVQDPHNLRTPFVTTSDFKKEPDASKWNPTPCQSR